MQHPIQIVFDANDPARLADFWAVALGYVRQPPPNGCWLSTHTPRATRAASRLRRRAD